MHYCAEQLFCNSHRSKGISNNETLHRKAGQDYPNKIQNISIKISGKRIKIKMFCFINNISKTIHILSLRPETKLNLYNIGHWNSFKKVCHLLMKPQLRPKPGSNETPLKGAFLKELESSIKTKQLSVLSKSSAKKLVSAGLQSCEQNVDIFFFLLTKIFQKAPLTFVHNA